VAQWSSKDCGLRMKAWLPLGNFAQNVEISGDIIAEKVLIYA